MAYPKEVAAFIAWSKAMVQGAQVERPKWKQVTTRANARSNGTSSSRRLRRKRRSRKRRNRGKKD